MAVWHRAGRLVWSEAFIRKLNEQGTTILLVEQNAKVALGAAGYGYALETGRVIIESDAASLRQD